MASNVDFSKFSTGNFSRGASRVKEFLWILTRTILFVYFPFGLYGLKRWILRCFGARVGANVIIKPGVIITFPWKLDLGDHVWLGEGSWLLNLDRISIGDHVCVSQRAMLCTGNHDYKSPSFDLITAPIRVESGAWVAACAWVGPGVVVGSHAILCAGSVTSKNLEAYGIYSGNPAVKVNDRKIEIV